MAKRRRIGEGARAGAVLVAAAHWKGPLRPVEAAGRRSALDGPSGLFNLTYGTTSFDFDGDGTFDTEIERYVNSEKYVNVGGATYEFAADKSGNRVTFTKLAVRRPDRAILKTGYPAPDFTLHRSRRHSR